MIVYSTHIHALGDPRYKLCVPLLVTIQQCDDEIIATIPEFGLYASGVSEELALMKLKDEIVLTYDRLSALDIQHMGRLTWCCLEAMRAVIVAASG